MAKRKTATAHGRKAPMPTSISPMLCTLTAEVINSPEYLYEIKWDGYRIISFTKKGSVKLYSRGGKDYTKKYPPAVRALQQLKRDVILDGEMVVLDEEGRPSFDAVQLYNGHDTAIYYYVFDILWLDGYDLKDLPLIERKQMLKEVIGKNDVVRFSDSFDDGENLYELMKEKGFEGVVAKERQSEYIEGDRSRRWLKIPTRIRQEFVIGGWAESDKARSFRSILFGAYQNGKLRWVGRSGGGYKEKEMPAILKELKSREIKHSPFENEVLDTKGAVIHWVKPEQVANFEFAAWTTSGRIRKPATWLGFRYDKQPQDVVLEVPNESVTKSIKAKTATHKQRQKAVKKTTARNSNWPAIERQPQTDKTSFELDDCSIDLFNVDRRLWKNITKADLIEYYHHVHEFILPYIQDRPQSLHFKINGPMQPGLYVKDMEGRQPECADIFKDVRRHEAAGKRKHIDYLVCNNEATLLWMINMGCIDVNPWNARTAHPDRPDWIVIDLDPSEEKPSDQGLARLRNTAMAAKAYFDSLQLKAYAKTSGKTGLHFLVPCSGFTTKEARAFAEKICAGIHELVPDDATITVSKTGRKGKVFIDFSQNDYADTIAAPYCVRPFDVPLVSTPLSWREINNTIDPRKWTMPVVLRRLDKKGDLFEDIMDAKHAAANNRILKKL